MNRITSLFLWITNKSSNYNCLAQIQTAGCQGESRREHQSVTFRGPTLKCQKGLGWWHKRESTSVKDDLKQGALSLIGKPPHLGWQSWSGQVALALPDRYWCSTESWKIWFVWESSHNFLSCQLVLIKIPCVQTHPLCEPDEASACQLVTHAFNLHKAAPEMVPWIEWLRLAEWESSNWLCGQII